MAPYFGSGSSPLQQRLGDLLLVGNDHREHVGRHEGADEGADMDQRGAAGEHVGVEVSRQENPQERYDGEQGGPLADGRAAEAVIGEPADSEAPHRDADRVQGLQLQDCGIDHPRPGAQIELDDQEQEAGEPRQIRFPLEPDQVAGQLLRRNGELLDVVEAAAVHLPRGAQHAFLHLLPLPQLDVESDEIEGGADPADAGDHVRPAEQEIEPVEGEGGQARVSSPSR